MDMLNPVSFMLWHRIGIHVFDSVSEVKVCLVCDNYHSNQHMQSRQVFYTWRLGEITNTHKKTGRPALVEYQEWFLVGGKRATNTRAMVADCSGSSCWISRPRHSLTFVVDEGGSDADSAGSHMRFGKPRSATAEWRQSPLIIFQVKARSVWQRTILEKQNLCLVSHFLLKFLTFVDIGNV